MDFLESEMERPDNTGKIPSAGRISDRRISGSWRIPGALEEISDNADTQVHKPR